MGAKRPKSLAEFLVALKFKTLFNIETFCRWYKITFLYNNMLNFVLL